MLEENELLQWRMHCCQAFLEPMERYLTSHLHQLECKESSHPWSSGYVLRRQQQQYTEMSAMTL